MSSQRSRRGSLRAALRLAAVMPAVLAVTVLADELRRNVDAALPKLRSVAADAAALPLAPGKWSSKQVIGHLIDSAANNHQRIVRAQLEDKPAMPGYDGDRWVELHRYQQRDWTELIGLWTALNHQLLTAARAVPDSAWSRTCTIDDSEPLTLKFVFEDYLEHMMHHLQHIGIQVEDLRAAHK